MSTLGGLVITPTDRHPTDHAAPPTADPSQWRNVSSGAARWPYAIFGMSVARRAVRSEGDPVGGSRPPPETSGDYVTAELCYPG
jgi:hypothetical protein